MECFEDHKLPVPSGRVEVRPGVPVQEEPVAHQPPVRPECEVDVRDLDARLSSILRASPLDGTGGMTGQVG